MPRFVILGKLTFKALEAMEDAKDRDIKGEKIIRAAGGELIAHYYTRHSADLFSSVIIIEGGPE